MLYSINSIRLVTVCRIALEHLRHRGSCPSVSDHNNQPVRFYVLLLSICATAYQILDGNPLHRPPSPKNTDHNNYNQLHDDSQPHLARITSLECDLYALFDLLFFRLYSALSLAFFPNLPYSAVDGCSYSSASVLSAILVRLLEF